jgi:hypothetical protein
MSRPDGWLLELVCLDECMGVDDVCGPVLTEDVFEDGLDGDFVVWPLKDFDFILPLIGGIERYGG